MSREGLQTAYPTALPVLRRTAGRRMNTAYTRNRLHEGGGVNEGGEGIHSLGNKIDTVHCCPHASLEVVAESSSKGSACIQIHVTIHACICYIDKRLVLHCLCAPRTHGRLAMAIACAK